MKQKNNGRFRVRFNKSEWLGEKYNETEISEETRLTMKRVKVIMAIFLPIGVVLGCVLDFSVWLFMAIMASFALFLVFFYGVKEYRNVSLIPGICIISSGLIGHFFFLRTIQRVFEGGING